MIAGKNFKITVLKHQKKFAELTDRYSAMVGGFGSAKTTAAGFKILSLLKRRREQKVKAVIEYIVPTYDIMKRVNMPKLLALFDQYKIAYIERRQERKIIVPAFGMSEIIFLSAMRPERIIGFDATDCIIDEFDVLKYEQQSVVWQQSIARLRAIKDFTLAITTTPEGYKYTYEKFVTKKVGKLMQIKTSQNTFNPPEYIENLRDQYDKLLIEQYVNGQFVNIKGHRAYYAFTREKNVIKSYTQKTRNLIVGWDFNVDPMCLVIGEFYNNKLTFFDEIKIHNANTFLGAETLLNKYPNRITGQQNKPYNIVAYPDMTGGARKTSATLSDLQIIKKNGMTIKGARNGFVRDRLNITNNAFDKGLVNVTENCKVLIEDFEQVITDEYGAIDKSNKNRTHMSDAGSYPISRIFPMMKPKIIFGRQ